MDGGGPVSSEERAAEKAMDDYLKSLGLHRKRIAKDGSCLFRAVAEQVLHCQSLHAKVRAKCVEFLKQNRGSYEAFVEGDFEDYLCKLQDPQHWVGEVEINALAVMYKRDFLIFQEPGKPPVSITDNNFKDKVRLCFLNGNHYDSVYPISHLKNAALCQSILYEVLYDGVFKVDRAALASCQRVGRPGVHLSDDNMAACVSSDESDADNVGEELWVENETSTSSSVRQTNPGYRGRGRGRHLSERMRRSLNPNLFRNVEYDVWHKTKRAQQRMDYCIAAGMQYTVGDRCQVRLEGSGRTHNATVKEVSTNNKMVVVYIEELGKRPVPLWTLRPPSDETSWSTVVNKDKRLSNGHGDWEERGRGRGRGKTAVPSSTSAPQAAPPGSGGRVQKQHSWPPQAPAEEQGGAKPGGRKLPGSAEAAAAFGLTEEERLAREEEERNVALVEIQLRDEHSFPALGTQSGMQGDGGRRKGGDKKRLQRSKMKSPVDDVPLASPPAGDRPKSSTPPPADSPLPAAAALLLRDSAPSPTPTCAAPTAKTSTPSYASAAGATPGSPPPPPAAPHSILSSANVFSFLTPVLPTSSSPLAPPSSSSSSSAPPPPAASSSLLPAKASASPPPLPPPTFIAPIAPSPVAAQGFLPRSSPPVSSLPRSPSPPSSSCSSSPLPIQHAGHVQEPPPAPGGSLTTPRSLQTGSQALVSQTQTQVSQALVSQTQTQVSQAQVSQTQTQVSQALVSQVSQAQVSQTQTQVSQTQTQVSQAQTQVSQASVTQEVAQGQDSAPQSQVSKVQTEAQPLPEADLSQTQTQTQTQVSCPPPQSQSETVQVQSSQTQSQAEAPPPPAQPESPSHPPSQHAPPPPPSLYHQLLSAPLPSPPPLPGAVPLQKLSQLYQDPLYPGFPVGEKGDAAATPPYSSSASGDDLPRDVGVLRFFFNLGVKAYSMPMFPPYVYILPLQQAHTMHPKLPSPRSPSPTPHFPPAAAPPRHQEAAYPHYPPTPPQYDHQPPLPEPPRPADPAYGPAAYPPPHRMSCAPPPPPWQQHQMPPPPRNPSYPVGYPPATPPYQVPPPSTQGYHPGPSAGHPLYPPNMAPYPPPSSLGYQTASAPEGLTLAVLSNSDEPVSMTTVKPSSTPGSPSPYALMPADPPPRGYRPHHHHKPFNPNKTYVRLGGPEPLMAAPPPPVEAMSVGCSTEDDWEEAEGFKPATLSFRGPRRTYRGGGGRVRGGGYDGGRGAYRRRPGGEAPLGYSPIQFSSSHRGRGW